MANIPIRLVFVVEHCFMYFLYYVKDLLNVVTVMYKYLQNWVSFGESEFQLFEQAHSVEMGQCRQILEPQRCPHGENILDISSSSRFPSWKPGLPVGLPCLPIFALYYYYLSLSSHRTWVCLVGMWIRMTTKGLRGQSWQAKPPLYLLVGGKKPHNLPPEKPIPPEQNM